MIDIEKTLNINTMFNPDIYNNNPTSDLLLMVAIQLSDFDIEEVIFVYKNVKDLPELLNKFKEISKELNIPIEFDKRKMKLKNTVYQFYTVSTFSNIIDKGKCGENCYVIPDVSCIDHPTIKKFENQKE